LHLTVLKDSLIVIRLSYLRVPIACESLIYAALTIS